MPLNTAAISQPMPARSSTAALLSKGITRLEGILKLTTAILALAAGVYTYLGVRELLNGNPTIVFFAAVIYSVAVSIGIYAFWIVPDAIPAACDDRAGRGLMFGCMLLGSLMIMAMSAWLNASALAGAAAIQQHLAIPCRPTPATSTRQYNALAAQSLLPDIQMAASRFAKLADAERAGSLTGTSGSGTVVQLLTQMSTQLDNLVKEVHASGERVSALYEQGGKHLAKMRELISSRGPIGAQRCLRVRSHVADGRDRSAAADLGRSRGEARGRRLGRRASSRRRRAGAADLADRQTSVVGKVESAIAAQSAALSAAADKILASRGSSPAGSSRSPPPKRCCAMPAISFRAGPARSRST